MFTVNETFISETETFDFISETRRPYKIYETRPRHFKNRSRDRDYIPAYRYYIYAHVGAKSMAPAYILFVKWSHNTLRPKSRSETTMHFDLVT